MQYRVMTAIINSVAALSLIASSCAAATPTACYEAAATRYRVSPLLLRAIAVKESGENNRAINNNSNGSSDYCAMQINSSWLPKLAIHKITADALLSDYCLCTAIGAWILAQCQAQHGNTWKAIGCYHSPDPARQRPYAQAVLGLASSLTR